MTPFCLNATPYKHYKPFGKGIKEKRTDVYAGYTYTQPLSEATKLRAGLGLGYEKYKDTTTSEKDTTLICNRIFTIHLQLIEFQYLKIH